MKNLFVYFFLLLLVFLSFSYSLLNAQWQKISVTDGANINVMAKDSLGYLYAVTNNQTIYRSSDNGSTWQSLTGGNFPTILSIISSESSVILSSYNGIFRSTNHGLNWVLSGNGLPSGMVTALYIKDNMIYAGCEGKIYKSSNDGLNWTTSGFYLNSYIVAMTSLGNRLFAETSSGSSGKMYVSTNNGDNWDSLVIGSSGFRFYMGSITASGNSIFAGGWPFNTFYQSTDFGLNWTSINGLPSPTFYTPSTVTARGNVVTISLTFSNLNYLIYVSTNSGMLFNPTASNLCSQGIKSCLITNNGIFAYSGKGIFKSTNFGVNWFGSNSGFSDLNFPCVIAVDSVVFAGTDGSGIYMSWNYGFTWSQISQFGNTSSSYSFRYDSQKVYLLTSQGIGYSTNTGVTWNIMPVPVSSASNNFCPKGDLIFLGTNQGIYKTTNFGINWVRSDNGIPAYYIFSSCIFTNNSIGLVQIWNLSAEYAMYKTTNNGTNWFLIQNPGGTQNMLTYLVENQNIIYAGTENGLFISTNSGNNWLQVNNGLPYTPVKGFVFKDGTIFIAMGSLNVFKSTDNGSTWQSYNEGLTTGVLRSMSSGGNYLYASGEGVFYFRNIQTNFVARSGSNIEKFSLSQNYPNPFNPSTIIRFQIKESRFVTLKVYDITGKQVAVIINEKLAPGEYETQFPNNSLTTNYLPSGVYFYQLKADDFTETKKMILIK